MRHETRRHHATRTRGFADFDRAGRHRHCALIDLSTGGLKLLATGAIELGAQLDLSLLDALDHPVIDHLQAWVVRRVHGGFAAEFGPMSPQQIHHLQLAILRLAIRSKAAVHPGLPTCPGRPTPAA